MFPGTDPYGTLAGTPPSPDELVAGICGRQHGVISAAQLATAGMTRSMRRVRLRAKRLFEIHPRVFSLTPTLTEDGWRQAALLECDGTLAWESTLHLFELVEFAPVEQHVIVPHWNREDVDGIEPHVIRGFKPGDVTRVRGIRTCTVARALLDVAPHTEDDDLRKLVKQAQYRRLINTLSLDAILKAHPGHRGLKNLGAVDPSHDKSESWLEDQLGKILMQLSDPKPIAQHWVRGLSGKSYRGDFALVEERILLEADGRSAHAQMLAFEDDKARAADLAGVNWLLLPFTYRRITRHAQAILREVQAAREERRVHPYKRSSSA